MFFDLLAPSNRTTSCDCEAEAEPASVQRLAPDKLLLTEATCQVFPGQQVAVSTTTG